MKLSENFAKTSKNVPADEASLNAKLLIQAGYIYKEMAGVYAFLPLGLSVLENIKQIIREEINSIGGQELIMTTLQRSEPWKTTDRWDEKNVDAWFKTKLQNNKELGLAWSHEEPITEMMTSYISSYRDLPVYVYQFQTKLRNELRAKSGIMRGREFLMKDLYSYSLNEAQHEEFYEGVKQAYLKIFKRVGLEDSTYLTFASGGAFTQFSHEFQTICEAGEDTIYIDETKKIAINDEVMSEEVIKQLGVDKAKLKKLKAAEVGNIFSFGGDKSSQLGLSYDDENGKSKPVILGSYGVGVSRLMGVVVEKFADDKGLVWPDNIAPAQIYLISVNNDKEVVAQANKIYDELIENDISVIFDDRDVRAGEKFADADLVGIPNRVVISDKSLSAGGIEFKKRTSSETEILSTAQLLKRLAE